MPNATDVKAMTTRGSPKYGSPPVVETVIGVQFPELRGFKSIHFGLYWERIRDRYPQIQDQPRLPAILAPSTRLHLLPGGKPERAWFISGDDRELIQLQPNRFHLNWRAREGAPYPSFEANSRKFFEEFGQLQQFCVDEKIDQPTPEVWEVTYFNHLIPNQNETVMELFGKAFAGLRWRNADDFLPRVPTGAAFTRIYDDIKATRGKQVTGDSTLPARMPQNDETLITAGT